MIGRNDDRRKEEAVKKAQMELKKKEKEAVREVCVSLLFAINRSRSSLTWYCRPQMPSSMFFQHNTALVPVSARLSLWLKGTLTRQRSPIKS